MCWFTIRWSACSFDASSVKKSDGSIPDRVVSTNHLLTNKFVIRYIIYVLISITHIHNYTLGFPIRQIMLVETIKYLYYYKRVPTLYLNTKLFTGQILIIFNTHFIHACKVLFTITIEIAKQK